MSTSSAALSLDGDPGGIAITIDPSTPVGQLRVISRGRGNRLEIGADCRIAGHLFLSGGATLRIGRGLTCTGRILCHLHEGSEVEIGENCLFAQEIGFRPSDAHRIIDIASGDRINPPRPIRIGAGVWVGEGVLFLKGAEVGPGSVVAARAMVTGVHGANELIGGSPARLLRSGIRWEA